MAKPKKYNRVYEVPTQEIDHNTYMKIRRSEDRFNKALELGVLDEKRLKEILRNIKIILAFVNICFFYWFSLYEVLIKC
jgi:hypothetical protein